MVKICQTRLLKLNFEIIPKKTHFLVFAKNFRRPCMKLKKFFCQFPNPWTLRVSGMGGYTSKCEKKSKSLHPTVQPYHFYADLVRGSLQYLLFMLSFFPLNRAIPVYLKARHMYLLLLRRSREEGRGAICQSTGSYISPVLLERRWKGATKLEWRGQILQSEGCGQWAMGKMACTPTLSKLGRKYHNRRMYAGKWPSPVYCIL